MKKFFNALFNIASLFVEPAVFVVLTFGVCSFISWDLEIRNPASWRAFYVLLFMLNAGISYTQWANFKKVVR